ncbi:MAG: hypothetical protein Q9208_004183 [Pyrenodesmia sp. 3 TL-2023]
MEYLDAHDSGLGEDESSASSLHPDRYDHEHISNIEVFSQDLQKAITNSFPRPKTSYVSVNVLLLRWTEDDLKVQSELTALKTVFENQYNFVVEQWHIPSTNSTRALQTKLYDFQNFHQGEDELLIVYYAGHGDPDRRGRSIWAAIELSPQPLQLPPAGPGMPPDSFDPGMSDDMMDISTPPASVAADTRVLLAVSIANNAICDITEWKEWLISQAPWDITGIEVKVENVFKSHSTMLIASLPIVVWDLLPNKAAYRFIGFVKSKAVGEGQQKVDPPSRGHQLLSEIEALKHKVVWTDSMERYSKVTTYREVAVLLLCWGENLSDTREIEIAQLETTFKQKFRYQTEVACLSPTNTNTKVQMQAKARVSDFAMKYDGPENLLIVYYAGHGASHDVHGLIFNRQKLPNDLVDPVKREKNRIVWTRIEEHLREAQADVLEIFDWYCFLEMGYTSVSGPNMFTKALNSALGHLVEKGEGRFTMADLLRTIRSCEPFPQAQAPLLFDWEYSTKKAGRTMLHPLRPAGGAAESSESTRYSHLRNTYSLKEVTTSSDQPVR